MQSTTEIWALKRIESIIDKVGGFLESLDMYCNIKISIIHWPVLASWPN